MYLDRLSLYHTLFPASFLVGSSNATTLVYLIPLVSESYKDIKETTSNDLDVDR
jgi:hypothetical protein